MALRATWRPNLYIPEIPNSSLEEGGEGGMSVVAWLKKQHFGLGIAGLYRGFCVSLFLGEFRGGLRSSASYSAFLILDRFAHHHRRLGPLIDNQLENIRPGVMADHVKVELSPGHLT